MRNNIEPARRLVEAVNDSGESAPAYAVFAPNGMNNSATPYRLSLTKPTADDLGGPLFFGERRAVAFGGFLIATMDFPVWARYTGSTPSVGDRMAATAGQFHMQADAEGPYQVVALNPKDGQTGSQTAIFIAPVAPQSPCPAQNAIHQITVIGSPTGGTFYLDYTINASKETLTFNWDDTASEVDTEMETHTEVGASDTSVTDGPFPDATIQIEFQGDLANTDIALPTADWSALTGGSGVAVISSMAQRGSAG